MDLSKKTVDWSDMSVEELRKIAIFRDIPNADKNNCKKSLINLCTNNLMSQVIYENLPNNVLSSLMRQRNLNLSCDFNRKKIIFCLLDYDEKYIGIIQKKSKNPWDMEPVTIYKELARLGYDFSPYLIDIQDCCYILSTEYQRN